MQRHMKSLKRPVNLALEFIDERWNKKTQDTKLFDIFSKRVICRNISGKMIGRENYELDSIIYDGVFPDYLMKLKKLEIFGSAIITAYQCTGTYLNPFPKQNLIKREENSEFEERISTLPIGTKLPVHLVEWVFIFSENKIERLYCSSDFDKYYLELGLGKSINKFNSNCVLDNGSILKELKNLYPLSNRETECMAFALSGFTAKSTGRALFISCRTVEKHLKNAYEKLHCANKQQCLELTRSNEALPIWQEYCNELIGRQKRAVKKE